MDETTELPAAGTPGGKNPWLIALAVAAVVLVLGGVIAAVTAGDDDTVEAAGDSTTTTAAAGDPAGGDEAVVSDAGSDTTTPGEAPAADTPGAPTDTPGQTTVPGADPAPTVTAPADLGTPKDPGPTNAPRPGIYRYAVEGEGGMPGSERQSGGGEGTTTVTDRSRSGGVVKQSITLAGQGFDSTSDVEWHADRVLVTRSEFTYGGSTGECDWSPDYVQAVLPLAEGATWKSESSCTVTGFGVPVVVNRSTSNTVTGLVRKPIAGRVLDVWAIRSVDDITFAGTTIHSESTSWFSPPLGLIVASEGTASGSDGTSSGDGSFSTELLNIDPE